MQADDRPERRIDAAPSGQSAARQQEIMLDQCSFVLDPDAHERFLAMLDTPVKPSKQLRVRMRRKPSWER
jgi:uncharacterized protein (DUF1778 family)